MRKQEDEIRRFITEYEGFLKSNNIDVAKSIIENTWFVYRYEKKYGYYEYFIRFSTVSELVDIILDEMKFELYCAIGEEIDSPKGTEHELADQIITYYKDKNHIPELKTLIDTIQQSNLREKSKFFELLDNLCVKKSNDDKDEI